ncbi:unnamed protein product [Discosporangium mesarthrocarpum]
MAWHFDGLEWAVLRRVWLGLGLGSGSGLGSELGRECSPCSSCLDFLHGKEDRPAPSLPLCLSHTVVSPTEKKKKRKEQSMSAESTFPCLQKEVTIVMMSFVELQYRHCQC